MAVETATAFRTGELVPLFQRMLALCKLKPTESLVVLTEPTSNQDTPRRPTAPRAGLVPTAWC